MVKLPGYQKYSLEQRARLQNKGIKVKIKHERLFVKTYFFSSPYTNNLFVDEIKVFLTKGQKENNENYRSFELKNNGGRTTVSLFSGKKLVGTGYSYVNPKDNFIRQKGISIALQRAIQDMPMYV